MFIYQDMYQFIISKEVLPPFILFLSHPQTPLPLAVMADLQINSYENTLLLVLKEDENDLFVGLNMLACFEVTSHLPACIYILVIQIYTFV